jgi:probable F420-dependent oxidoreductase
MRFGLGLPTGMEGLINPVHFFKPSDFLKVGRLAEELGYDSVWGNDHYAPQHYVTQKYPDPPNFYEVLTVLTSIAAITDRIELGTAVLVLPMRDPVTVAKQVTTLDQLSSGRLLLGVGIGAYREEYEAARPDLMGRNRGSMLEEGLELLQLLTTQERVTYEGRFYRVEDLRMYPKPFRSPFRLLVGGHQQRGIDRAVAWGQGWIPGWRPFEELKEWIVILREKAARAGRDPAEMIVAPQFSCLLGESQEQAEKDYMNSGMVQHRISLAYTGRDPSAAMENNLVGAPETVLKKLEFLHEAGVDHLACITLCVESVPQYLEQLHMFAEEVMRPFRRAHEGT